MGSKRAKPKKPEAIQPATQPKPEPELPVEEKTAGKKKILLIVLAILLVAVAIFALNAESLLGNLLRSQSGKATQKCQTITKVVINPGKIAISPKDPPVEMSALAYDIENVPVWQGVSYEWGISSSNTVGTLKQNNDLVTFTPLNKGTGDLFVKATNACTQTAVIGSVPVVVEPTLTPVVSP